MGFRERARRAKADVPFHRLASLVMGAMLATIACGQAYTLGWRDFGQLFTLVWIYGAAGAVGTALGSSAASFLNFRGPRAFAAWALLVGGLTMAFGAVVFALQYRAAYSQWHADAFTLAWMVQGVFTMAGAVYFWAVLGTRMILPWAIVPLVLGALAFARRSR